MKTFSTSGTGNQQTLSEIESDKIPIYDSLTDVTADLANLSVGQIVATKDTGSELSAPVDTVQSGNMHAVTSNAVAESLSYSTTEQKTGGTWIDGKPIYRIVLTTTSQINTDDVSFGGLQTIISNLNIDTAIYAGGVDNINRKTFRALLFSSINGFLPFGSGLAPSSKIILEYTKTTD